MPVNKFFSYLISVLLLLSCSPSQEPMQVEVEDSSGISSDASLTQDDLELDFYAGFTLIDTASGESIPNYSMTVENGEIVWVGSASELEVPEGETITDLTGKYVMPGLIDLHTHLAVTHNFGFDHEFYSREQLERELRTYASYGVTSVLVQGTDKDVVFDLIQDQQENLPNVARIYTDGQGVVFEGGYGGVPGITDPVSTPDEVIEFVEEQAAKDVTAIKLWVDDEFGTMPKMPAEISQAAIDTAHRFNLPVLAHVFYLEDAKRLARQGIDGFVHAVRDQRIDQEFIDLLLENDVWQVSHTLSREAFMFAYAEQPWFLDNPFFTRAINSETLVTLGSEEYQEQVRSNPHYDQFEGIFEISMANQKLIADAGVRYAFGTDSGPPGRFPGFAAHWELELMVEAGLSPIEVLRASTLSAAEFLEESHLGRISPSSAADFIVLNSNPLQDITNTRDIHSVYLAGDTVD